MTTVANYIAIQDSSTTLSPPGLLPDLPDAHQFQNFDADANLLQEQDNILVVNAHGDGAEVVISDVVITYRLEV